VASGLSATSTQFSDLGRPAGTYYYVVVATNASGTPVTSRETSATVP
jgi:hypothetical protein